MNSARAVERSGVPLVRMGALLLTAVAISVNFTNYGPLIPVLQGTLHITNGEAGLFSTLLYGGIACSYLPGGMLADRYGARRVLLGALLLVGLGGCLLPLYESLPWMVMCRLCIGLGAGAAIVAASQSAARLGNFAALGQGLFGGAMQAGAGLGLLVTPGLQTQFGWRGAFLIWGLLGLAICFLWSNMPREAVPEVHPRTFRQALWGFRSSAVLCLGLVHLGTLGLGQALAPWLALYFAQRYGLPLGLAATLGSIGLFAGIIFRPLGGVLLARRVFGAVALMRVGAMLACIGVLLLALPVHIVFVAGIGLALFAFGTTLPYASVLGEAGRVGKRSGLGTGTVQGLVALLSAPASSLGPPLIGLLMQREGNFSLALGALALVGLLAIPAALLAGHILTRIWKLRHTSSAMMSVPDMRTRSLRSQMHIDPETNLHAVLARLAKNVHGVPQTTAHASPIVMMPGFLSRTADGQRTVFATDALTMQRLLDAGAIPVVLPLSPLSFQQGEQPHLPIGEELYRGLFDEVIWPFFCQMVLQQVRGMYLPEVSQKGSQEDNEGKLNGLCRSIVCRSVVMLATLLGIPVLSAEQVLRKDLQRTASQRKDMQSHESSFWSIPPATSSSLIDRDEETRAICAQFVAACKAYTPLSPDALLSLQAPIYAWLRQRQRAMVHQLLPRLITLDLLPGANRQNRAEDVPSGRWVDARLRARQQKLRVIRGTACLPRKRGTASEYVKHTHSGDQFAAPQS